MAHVLQASLQVCWAEATFLVHIESFPYLINTSLVAHCMKSQVCGLQGPTLIDWAFR